jgi:hypothetical protein
VGFDQMVRYSWKFFDLRPAKSVIDEVVLRVATQKRDRFEETRFDR